MYTARFQPGARASQPALSAPAFRLPGGEIVKMDLSLVDRLWSFDLVAVGLGASHKWRDFESERASELADVIVSTIYVLFLFHRRSCQSLFAIFGKIFIAFIDAECKNSQGVGR